MSGLLNSQRDLYAFQTLLEKMVTGLTDNDSGEYICRQVIYFLTRYDHSREITLKQMQLLLTMADKVIPFLVQYSGGKFLDFLLKTDACKLLRARGINLILETKFGHMDAIDHVYLLFVEYLCWVLKRNNRFERFHNSDIELFLKTINNIRAVDQTYVRYIPTKKLLLEAFHRVNRERRITSQEELDIVQGKGRVGLLLFPNNKEGKAEVERNRFETLEVEGQMAVVGKSGIFSNLEIDIKPHYEYYMNAHNIPIVQNADKYLIASSDCDPLMNARYRDLTNLWPVVTYHVGIIPLRPNQDEFKFPKEVHFCRAFDLDGRSFIPLPNAITI